MLGLNSSPCLVALWRWWERLAQKVGDKNLWLGAVKTLVPRGSFSHLLPEAVPARRVDSKTLGPGASLIQKPELNRVYTATSLTPSSYRPGKRSGGAE